MKKISNDTKGFIFFLALETILFATPIVAGILVARNDNKNHKLQMESMQLIIDSNIQVYSIADSLATINRDFQQDHMEHCGFCPNKKYKAP